MKYFLFISLAIPIVPLFRDIFCPPDYKPTPSSSCFLKTCPPGTYCCFDGCSHKCSRYRKKPSDPYD
ncbi:hypothetical protein Anas_07590 [Armadillidium nasatum]|uniref:WAP domain-containing protein n=1 Tax=Armadillidium nasatum TaxID=96803 RepID=A0A5N5SY41_9CRUS|nr:hypothetical protein Anas_07590 [Armadillidium nasatum]